VDDDLQQAVREANERSGNMLAAADAAGVPRTGTSEISPAQIVAGWDALSEVEREGFRAMGIHP